MPATGARYALATALITALAACAAGAAGCRGEEAVRAENRTVEAELHAYRIEPQRVEVDAGRITLRARTAGPLAHNLRVRQGRRVIGGTDTQPPGGRSEATVTLEPGDYRMFCSISNHESLGMYGGLIVR
jgi:plastocyanin